MTDKEQATFELGKVAQGNNVVDEIKIDDSNPVETGAETIKATKEDRVVKSEKPTEKPKGKGMPKKLLFGAIGGTVALSAILIGGIVYFTQTPDDAQREALRQQQLAAMQASQSQEQTQNQSEQLAQQEEAAKQAMAQQNAQNVDGEQSQQNNAQADATQDVNSESQSAAQPSKGGNGQIGSEIGGEFVFDSDGNIAGATEKEASKTKERLSTEQILANKDIRTYTEDELKSAWTIVDVELTNITATQNALSNRMRELGIEPPYSQLEARQAIHDKALIEEITMRLSDKMNQNMLSLNKKMDDLNKSQIVLSRDIANSLSDVMHRIDIEDINNQKQQKGLDELTKANSAVLNKYQIKQMASGRVWIIDPNTQKANSYTINDNIGDGIVIEDIDLSNYKVITNKGEIKYNFK